MSFALGMATVVVIIVLIVAIVGFVKVIKIGKQFDGMSKHYEKEIEQLYRNLQDTNNNNITEINSKANQAQLNLENHIRSVDEEFSSIWRYFEETNRKIDENNQRFDSNLDSRLDKLENKLKELIKSSNNII